MFFEKTIKRLQITGWRRTCAFWAGVSAVFLIITALHMGVSFVHMGTHVFGPPGDHTAGIMYNTWVGSSPIPGVTHMTNYPYGEDLWQPLAISTFVPSTMHLALSHFTDIVWGWNLLVLIGYMSSALAMFGFIYWLTRNGLVAFFAAYAATFTPFHEFASWGHIAGLLSAIFILAIWQFFALWRKPQWWRAILFGATLGIGFYSDGYFILIGLVLLMSLWAAAVAYGLLVHKTKFILLMPQFRALFLASVVVAASLLPLAWMNFQHSALISSIFDSSRGNIVANAQTYSAQISMYVNTRSVLFLGFIVIALALIGVALLWRQYREDEKARVGNASPLPFPGLAALVLTITATWVSLRPKSELFGLTIYNPSALIVTLTSSWRVFGRLYMLVVIGVVVLASLGLAALLRRYPARRYLIVGGSLLLLIVELWSAFPMPKISFNYNDAPAVYSWLKGNAEVRAVAEYPLDGSTHIDNLTFQEISGKPILNSMLPNSAQASLRTSIGGINDPQTLPVLRALGVDVVNTRIISRGVTLDLPSAAAANVGLREIVFPANPWQIRSFAVNPGPVASYALAFSPDQNPEVGLKGDGSATYALIDNPVLALIQLPNATVKPVVTVEFDISADSERRAVILQNGKVVWTGTLDANVQHVRLEVSPLHTLNMFNERSAQPTQIVISKLYAN